MKRFLLAILLLAALTAVHSQNMVVFGDSLSDSGYGAYRIQLALNTSAIYPAPPYWKGRYSDGPTWVEDSASALGVKLYNYACGGSSSGATPSAGAPLLPPFAGLTQPNLFQRPSLAEQIEFYLADNLTVDKTANAEDVYVVASGNNDVILALAGFNVTASDIAASLEDAVESLYNAGARKFVLTANSRIYAPAFNTVELLRLSQQLSAELFLALASFASSASFDLPGSSVEVFNFGGALLEVYGNATQLGITNTTVCYRPVPVTLAGNSFEDMGNQSGYLCPDPTQHLNFDDYHPTSTVHAGVARAFLRDVAPAFWQGSTNRPASAPEGAPNAASPPTASGG